MTQGTSKDVWVDLYGTYGLKQLHMYDFVIPMWSRFSCYPGKVLYHRSDIRMFSYASAQLNNVLSLTRACSRVWVPLVLAPFLSVHIVSLILLDLMHTRIFAVLHLLLSHFHLIDVLCELLSGVNWPIMGCLKLYLG